MPDSALRARLVDSAVAGKFSGFVRTGVLLTLIGAGLFVVSLLGEGSHRAWQAFHVNWLFFTGLAGGSVALTAVHKLARAKWSGVIIRFSQAAVSFLPVSLVGLVLIFTVGYQDIYGHMSEQLHSLPHGKAVWLGHGVMFGRLAVVLGLLYWVGWSLIRADFLPDLLATRDKVDGARRARFDAMLQGFDGSAQGQAAHQQKVARLAGIYAPLYAIGFTLVAFDMVMALQPHWFSNLLGAFYFMASFLGAHMLLALLMLVGGKETGVEGLITPKQRHDLGKLCFGFTVFWAYLMWSQFLVIWYGNLPEETGFVFQRMWGPWRPVAAMVFAGMFLIPFAGLISVVAKKTRFTLALFATISLSALWLERYLLVIPSITAAHGPTVGVPELAATLSFVGLFLLRYGLFARTFPMVSPRLAEVTLARESHH